jgi:hypothetical protein
MTRPRCGLWIARLCGLALCAHGALSWAQGAYKAPRTWFGDPDLQGLWTNASHTVLERPATMPNKLVVSREEAKAIEDAINGRLASDSRPTPASVGAPAAGGDVRGYNTSWLDTGSRLGVVNGEIRTSWIVDPPSGRVPYSAAGTSALRAAVARSFDGPEVRPLGERCILGFGWTSGPPMLNVLYNNHYQFVQSPGYVTIVAEMNHDARIVRLNAKHLPEHVRPWMGDSIGRWEGDTLVVETTNFHPGMVFNADVRHYLYMPSTAKITERFTRVAANEILYQFTVAEPVAYTQTWRGEMPLRIAPGPMYEYACHEGNRSLDGILRGARVQERQSQGGTR